MTATEAKEWVSDQSDDDVLDRDELVAAWEALYCRKLGDDDVDDDATLWSECVNVVGEPSPALAECEADFDGFLSGLVPNE